MVPVTNVGTVTTWTVNNLSLVNAKTYEGVIQAVDYAGNVSTEVSSSVIVDTDGPVAGQVADRDNSDVEWISSTSTTNIHWENFSDTLSGIDHYEYAIGTTPGATNVLTWTENGLDTNVTVSNLDLIHDATYYGSVRATDIVGHISPISTSNGIVVDIFDPTVGAPNDGGPVDLDYQGPSDTLGIYWSGNDTREISFYEYSVA